MANKFTEEERQFIKQNCKGIPLKQMLEMVNKKFGSNRSFGSIKAFYFRNGLKTGIDTKFKKGRDPFNKGVPIEEWMSEEHKKNFERTQFKNNYEGINVRPLKPVGARTLRSDGYVWIKTKQPNKWELEHRVNWKKEHGDISTNEKLIHLDGDVTNNKLSNLRLVSAGELAIINKKFELTNKKEINESIINTVALLKKASERRCI